MQITKEIEQLFETIAKEELLFDTLEERHSDSLDFKDTSVLAVKSALTRAYLAGAAAKKQDATVKVVFTRKPSSLAEVTECIETVAVCKTKTFTAKQYDAFASKPLNEYPWLKNLAGNELGLRSVIKVIAPERTTIFIDPSGMGYARYVGVQVEA
ncbi:MAG: hypothetical protein K0R98_734 [Rickettsiaceae bacterium]|nr:hypothetical protein [Rickettsiaceae bacterium]